MNGGTSWVDIGFNLHPDYHAIAIRKDNPSILVMGNDGGVWWSASRGGRLNAGDPLTATQWSNLNGVVNPGNGGTIFRTNIQHGSVHQHRHQPGHSQPLLWRLPGQWHAAQVNGEQYLVRHRQR